MKSFSKRVIALFAVILLSSGLYAQSLREYVCVVRGNLSEENKTFLEDLKSSFEGNGYSYYAGYINSFLKGTFGSGFIWYASDGKPYIVTNRHVVSDYESVNLSFENEDGSVSEFKNMRIAFIDDEVDIALIALPDSFKRDGLLFTTKKLSDGEDVFSAGFPGLGGEPSWQLGKGVVSNSFAKIKELLNPEISTIIQHTAQIDGGNSGGPLLVKDSSVKAGYKVCGVNTWRAISRQNTNFSIPVSCVNNRVKNNFSKKGSEALDSRLSDFVKAATVKDDFTGLVPYISNECVSKYGEKALKDVLARASTNVRSYVASVFKESPIEGLRYAIAYFVWSKFSSEERADIGEITDEATGKNIKFLSGEKSLASSWVEESGYWKIFEFEGLREEKNVSEKDKARNKVRTDPAFAFADMYHFSIFGGYSRHIDGDFESFNVNAQFQYDYVAAGISITKDEVYAEVDDTWGSNSWNAEDSGYRLVNIVNIGPFAQVRLPMLIKIVNIIPFAEARAGMSFFKDQIELKLQPVHLGLGAGLDISVDTHAGFAFLAGSKYVWNFYSPEFMDFDFIKTDNIMIYAGIKFSDKL